MIYLAWGTCGLLPVLNGRSDARWGAVFLYSRVLTVVNIQLSFFVPSPSIARTLRFSRINVIAHTPKWISCH